MENIENKIEEAKAVIKELKQERALAQSPVNEAKEARSRYFENVKNEIYVDAITINTGFIDNTPAESNSNSYAGKLTVLSTILICCPATDTVSIFPP